MGLKFFLPCSVKTRFCYVIVCFPFPRNKLGNLLGDLSSKFVLQACRIVNLKLYKTTEAIRLTLSTRAAGPLAILIPVRERSSPVPLANQSKCMPLQAGRIRFASFYENTKHINVGRRSEEEKAELTVVCDRKCCSGAGRELKYCGLRKGIIDMFIIVECSQEVSG